MDAAPTVASTPSDSNRTAHARRNLRLRENGTSSRHRPAHTFCGKRFIACRKGGTVSIPGVYGGFLDKMPFGAAFGKGLTFKMGQTNMHSYMPKLLDAIQEEKIDPRLSSRIV